MIVVHFSESSTSPAQTVEAEERVPLVDLCDEARAPVGFGCRTARCTTCRVEILEGSRWIEPPEVEESELLTTILAPPNVRLACQAIVRDGSGVVRLRWLGPARSRA